MRAVREIERVNDSGKRLKQVNAINLILEMMEEVVFLCNCLSRKRSYILVLYIIARNESEAERKLMPTNGSKHLAGVAAILCYISFSKEMYECGQLSVGAAMHNYLTAQTTTAISYFYVLLQFTRVWVLSPLF